MYRIKMRAYLLIHSVYYFSAEQSQSFDQPLFLLIFLSWLLQPVICTQFVPCSAELLFDLVCDGRF